jgi:hypothetical protein
MITSGARWRVLTQHKTQYQAEQVLRPFRLAGCEVQVRVVQVPGPRHNMDSIYVTNYVVPPTTTEMGDALKLILDRFRTSMMLNQDTEDNVAEVIMVLDQVEPLLAGETAAHLQRIRSVYTRSLEGQTLRRMEFEQLIPGMERIARQYASTIPRIYWKFVVPGTFIEKRGDHYFAAGQLIWWHSKDQAEVWKFIKENSTRAPAGIPNSTTAAAQFPQPTVAAAQQAAAEIPPPPQDDLPPVPPPPVRMPSANYPLKDDMGDDDGLAHVTLQK